MDQVTSSLASLGLSGLSFPETSFPTYNQVDIYRSHIAELLHPITGADTKLIYSTLQWTATLDNGDLMLPVPGLRIKGKKPDAVCADILSQFPESPLVQHPSMDKNFLRFFFKPAPLSKLVLPEILKNRDEYGFNPMLGLRDPANPAAGRQKMVVEFSSPNIAKPFHAGHLRSTIIGGFLSNIYEKAGYETLRMNYLGDWGKQYGVLGIGFSRFGDEAALQANPVGHLYDVYVRISAIDREEGERIKALRAADPASAEAADLEKNGVDQQARNYFKRMVDGDEEALGLWRRFRDLSIVKYKATFARLNIRFDHYLGESLVKDESMDKVEEILREKGISEISDGAVMVDLTKHSKKLGKTLIRKRDGTSLYLTRDIAGIMERDEAFPFDKHIYVVASQQDLHFQQLFKILELMGGDYAATGKKLQHINFGMVHGMSTRKGTAKFLDDILHDVGEKMHEVMRGNQGKYVQVEDPEKTADTLGISAVMVQDMSGKRVNGYEFDINRMTSFEGDTGPYLQYAHARLCSIARKAELTPEELASADFSLLTEKHAVEVVRSLARWPDVFINTLKTQEPVTVLTYLFKMTHLLSSSYDVLNVVRAEPEVKKARGALYECARTVLSNGMRLLGLNPVERM